jgi:ankyrin repeat protein
LQALIDAGADLNAQDENGQTSLMNAATYEDLEGVRALLLAGADVNLKNKEGDTAWDLTSETEIEELLVGFGAVVGDEPPAEEEPQ